MIHGHWLVSQFMLPSYFLKLLSWDVNVLVHAVRYSPGVLFLPSVTYWLSSAFKSTTGRICRIAHIEPLMDKKASFLSELQKRADRADQSVLIFPSWC